MPYTKRKTDELALLLGKYDLKSGRKLATILDCSPPTAYKRVRDPSLLTVGDLRKLARRGHIPMDELRAAL